MARDGVINGAEVRWRDPWGTFLLNFVTLGIYKFVWYYKINREMRDHGRSVDPVMSVLAVTLGTFVIVPALVSIYRTAARVRQTQEAAGAPQRINPRIALFLGFLGIHNLINFYLPYVQSHLNKAWDAAANTATTPENVG